MIYHRYHPLFACMVSHLFTLPLGAPWTIKNWLTQHFTICSKNGRYRQQQMQMFGSLKYDGCAQVPSCNCHREKWKRPGFHRSLSCYLEFYWQSELICTKNHSSWVLLAEQTNLYQLLFNLISKKKCYFYWKQGGSPSKQKYICRGNQFVPTALQVALQIKSFLFVFKIKRLNYC